VAPIQIYFWDNSHREGNEGADQARCLKGRERGMGFGGKGSQPFPHQLNDVGERCKLPSGVRGGAPKTVKFGAT